VIAYIRRPRCDSGEVAKKRYVLLDADAVEKMLAPSTTLARRRNRITVQSVKRVIQYDDYCLRQQQRSAIKLKVKLAF
jgi:hypothetical protein